MPFTACRSVPRVLHFERLEGEMPTAKKRINLSVDDALYEELERLRHLRQAPSLSAVVVDLAKEALALQEDLYFAEIADSRRDEPEISHEEIWD